jgi:hypothetical protein
MLRIFCLDGSRLVHGSFRFLVQIVDIIHMGDGLLDVRRAAVCFLD